MNSHYITSLDTRDLGAPYRAIINQPFGWYSARYDITGINPLGFVSDEASVPRFPIVFWLFGGRGTWPAWPHDLGYAWPIEGLTRHMWDMVFHDLHGAYHFQLENQRLYRQVWRKFQRGGMTTGVVLFGRIAYKSLPGCLDRRAAKRRKCTGDETVCRQCLHYYPRWRDCVRSGYQPNLWKEHMA